jgi:2'-5' RNA ligase
MGPFLLAFLEKTMRRNAAHPIQSDHVTRRTWNGGEYLVAPVVALVAGVVNGEFVPADELGKSLAGWNGRPVPLGHPMRDGHFVSANQPEVMEDDVYGMFFNAAFDGQRLLGEIWLDVTKAQRMGGDALTALARLEAGEPLEVSTAYFCDVEQNYGDYQGRTFAAVQHNLVPDHLAILLHEAGACAWSDGCGTPRVNAQQDEAGVMVAFFLKMEDVAALAVTDLPTGSVATPAEEMHLTLAYLGTVDEVQIDELELLRIVGEFARTMPLVRGQVSGIGRFAGDEGDGLQALYASFDGPYLPEWRAELVAWLDMSVPVRRNHGFTPHITLAYVPAAAATALLPPASREVSFERLSVSWGAHRTDFALQGINGDTAGLTEVALAKNDRRACKCKNHEGEMMTVKINNTDSNVGSNVGSNVSAEAGLDVPTVPETPSPADETSDEVALIDAASLTVKSKNAALIPGEVSEIVKLIADLGGVAAVKESLELMKANRDESRQELIQELTANQWCAFSADELRQMTNPQLTKLAQSLRVPDFAARGGMRAQQTDEWENYQTPA